MGTTWKEAPAGSWLKVADNLDTVLISTTGDPIRVHVADTGDDDPGPGAAFHEVTAAVPFSQSGVPGQRVYIQAWGPVPVTVSVTAV